MTDKHQRIADWLRDIRQAIDYAKEDVGAMSKEEFFADGKTQRWCGIPSRSTCH